MIVKVVCLDKIYNPSMDGQIKHSIRVRVLLLFLNLFITKITNKRGDIWPKPQINTKKREIYSNKVKTHR